MLIQSLFSKSIETLSEEDLVLFFEEPKTENDKLEFKSYREFAAKIEKGNKNVKDTDAFKNILTTICAFLNTDGGVLIWGAPEGKIINGKEKSFSGALSPVTTVFEKDQVINKIVSAINPTPNRILFKAIPVKSGGFIYLFEVLASDFAPHQVMGTYYMRLDGQTKYAPHQYIDALIRRIQTPRLRMQIKFGDILNVGELVSIPFNVTIWNAARQVNEKNVNFTLSSFAQILKDEEVFTELKEETTISFEAAKILHHGNPVRYTFFIITPLNKGYGRRRIPVRATLSGDTAPMIFSEYIIEFLFGNPELTSYTLISSKENIYGSDLVLEYEENLAEARLDFAYISSATSESVENMKKWKPG